MDKIITFLDAYLQKTGKESISAVEANALLDKAGILNDDPRRHGLPLRRKLRNGELPYAYQVRGRWIIPLSTAEKPVENEDVEVSPIYHWLMEMVRKGEGME